MDNQAVNQGFAYTDKLTNFLQRRPVIYQFLRFACIGFLNTGLNFLILNAVSKALDISQGLSLGGVAALSFSAAVVQSYLWNSTWTFGAEQGVDLAKNLVRLISVGSLGISAIILVFIASGFSVSSAYFFILLAVYLLIEVILWRKFGFHLSDWKNQGTSFLVFFIVTLIGLGINSGLVSVISVYLHITGTDLDKNIASALATGVSLFWNFTGYKVIVFKK